MDYNEFGLTGKRYRSDEGIRKRGQKRIMQQRTQIKSKIFNLPSAYVSETEEEDSNESDAGGV